MNKYFKVLVLLIITLVFCAMSFFTESSGGSTGYGLGGFGHLLLLC